MHHAVSRSQRKIYYSTNTSKHSMIPSNEYSMAVQYQLIVYGSVHYDVKVSSGCYFVHLGCI